MKKPKNRKERIDMIVKKLGTGFAVNMLYMNDKEVKQFTEDNYEWLKQKEDYIENESTCIRCGENILHHTECGCGFDRAVFSEEDWKEDIKAFSNESDRCPKDEEFINNKYKIIE